ncbi:MAG: hypothetical protein MZV64_27905 [Ignavibacteriales bacterium]|nr:hypothetical protein [Ignavibacteriales bacterium]
MAGVPPTAGFMGKLYVFSAAIQADYVGLAIIGVANSVISAFYYLRITVVMYMAPATGRAPGRPPVAGPGGGHPDRRRGDAAPRPFPIRHPRRRPAFGGGASRLSRASPRRRRTP